jgi:hypothetical protein
MKLKIIVTGTGRCGTNFMANMLTSMGLPCGHEAIFGPEGIERAIDTIEGRRSPKNSKISKIGTILSDEGRLVGDSSFMAAPFLEQFDSVVIHLVRNPTDVVASLMGSGFRNFLGAKPSHFDDMPDHFIHEKFIYDHLPDLEAEMSQLDRACLFYLRWNEMIEASGKVDMRHRVEDSPEKIKKFLGFSGECYSDANCNSFAHNKKRKISQNQIEDPEIKRQFRDMMQRYGYKERNLTML